MVIAAFASDDDDTASQPTSYSSYTSSYSSYSPTYSTPSYSTSYDFSSEPTDDGSDLPTDGETSTGTDTGGLKDNKIYDTGKMKSVGCQAKLPSKSALGRFAKNARPCLDKAWKAQLTKAGVTHTSPEVVTSEQPATSPCGGTGDLGYVPPAFYCGTNQTIYITMSSARDQAREHLFVLVAHEYAHHVQALVGINEAYGAKYEQTSETAKRSRLTRRNELQAQCFAGLFVGQNYRTMGESPSIRNAENRVGDDHLDNGNPTTEHRTHGSYRSNSYWYPLGFDTANTGKCNTWTAPGPRVA